MDNDRKVDCMKYSCTVSQGICCSFFNFISTSEMNCVFHLLTYRALQFQFIRIISEVGLILW